MSSLDDYRQGWGHTELQREQILQPGGPAASTLPASAHIQREDVPNGIEGTQSAMAQHIMGRIRGKASGITADSI